MVVWNWSMLISLSKLQNSQINKWLKWWCSLKFKTLLRKTGMVVAISYNEKVIAYPNQLWPIYNIVKNPVLRKNYFFY